MGGGVGYYGWILIISLIYSQFQYKSIEIKWIGSKSYVILTLFAAIIMISKNK